MSKVVPFPVDCACKHNKNFKLPVVIEEEKKKRAKPIPIQINCPFRNEEGCAKHLTIELPTGYKLKRDDGTFRNGDIF